MCCGIKVLFFQTLPYSQGCGLKIRIIVNNSQNCEYYQEIIRIIRKSAYLCNINNNINDKVSKNR